MTILLFASYKFKDGDQWKQGSASAVFTMQAPTDFTPCMHELEVKLKSDHATDTLVVENVAMQPWGAS